MAAPNQPIAKYVELYDLLCEKLIEDTRQTSQESRRMIAAGASEDEMQAFFVAHRKNGLSWIK